MVTQESKGTGTRRLTPEIFSPWEKLRRSLAWIFRFIHNTMLLHVYRNKGELTSKKIQDAETHTIKSTQEKTFQGECDNLKSKRSLPSKSKVVYFKPVLCEDGIRREDTRHSMLLTYHIISYHTSEKNLVDKVDC